MLKKTDGRIQRLAEEQVYELVLEELESNKKRPGIWAKAFADSDGSEDKTRPLYIKYREQSMLNEMSLQAEEERHIQKVIEKNSPESRQRQEELQSLKDKAIDLIAGMGVLEILCQSFII